MRAKIFKGTVLLITGDERLQNSLQQALLQAGYGIRIALNQEDALQELRTTTPAILVVDRRDSGFSRLRQETPFLPPIVTVTYHAEPCDERHCAMDLEDGASRAVCNASPAIIVALLGAVLRRQRWEQQCPKPTHYVSHGITVDLWNCEVRVGTAPVHISRTEFRILESLVVAPGHYLSRKALLDQIWGEGFAIFPHVLDVHIWSIRRKLNPARMNPELIMTVKGAGFKLRSAPQPERTTPFQPYGYAAHAMRPLVSDAVQKPARAAGVSTLGGLRWQHQPAQPVSTRYRSRPAASGQERKKRTPPVPAVDALS